MLIYLKFSTEKNINNIKQVVYFSVLLHLFIKFINFVLIKLIYLAKGKSFFFLQNKAHEINFTCLEERYSFCESQNSSFCFVNREQFRYADGLARFYENSQFQTLAIFFCFFFIFYFGKKQRNTSSQR